MTDDPWIWVIAGLQIATAVGVVVFWGTWFGHPHEEPWLPVGYIQHERVFVFPDSMLAITLVVSAVLLITEDPLGDSFALVAAGMLAFLGVIDLAYFAQHGMFARERDGLLNAGLVIAVLALAIALVVRFA